MDNHYSQIFANEADIVRKNRILNVDEATLVQYAEDDLGHVGPFIDEMTVRNDYAGIESNNPSIVESESVILKATQGIEPKRRITRTNVPKLIYTGIDLGEYQITLIGTNCRQNVEVFARQIQNVMVGAKLAYQPRYTAISDDSGVINTGHKNHIASLDHLVKNTFQLDVSKSFDPDAYYNGFVTALKGYKIS